MFFLHKSNGVFLLLFCGIVLLKRTDAFLSTCPSHAKFQANPPRKMWKENKMAKFRDVLVGGGNRVTKLPAATTDDDSGGEESRGTLIGTLVLLTVPLSWGTYVPVGKLI